MMESDRIGERRTRGEAAPVRQRPEAYGMSTDLSRGSFWFGCQSVTT